MIVVVGGGITGLSAARRLADAGASFLLLEGGNRLGGKIVTERTGGFTIEGGPDCFLASKPDGVGLVRQLGLDHRLCATDPANRGTFVRRGDALHPLPEGITGLVPTRIAPLLLTRTLSLAGRLRAGLEPFVPAGAADGDESIAAFARRRFGREAYDWLIEPLLSGVYAGDGEQLSLTATFPMLAQLERTAGSVLRAMANRRGRSATGGFVTLHGGLGELVETLVGRLPEECVRLAFPVERIERSGTAYRVCGADGSSIACDRVILALPAHAAAPVVAGLDPRMARELGGIPFVSTATVSLGFPPGAVGRLPGYGFVSPRAAGGPIVAGTWTSNKFPGRAPAAGTLVRFFLGRSGSEDIIERPDDEIVALARAELQRLCGVTATPVIARVFRWPRSLPQYVVGHLERLERIAQLTRGTPGLLLAGASYRGVGIPDCIASGWTAAGSALEQVGAAA